MKEDYLWDKTGEDAEIRRLENALLEFRYTETAPPELPQKVFTLEKATPRRFFQRFGFAFAAFAAVVVIFCAVWLQIADNKIPVIDTVAEKTAPTSDDNIADEKIIKTRDEITPVKVFDKNEPRAVAKNRRNILPNVRPNKAVQQNIKVKEPTETLTAEEKYAYDQLMLALSITGSKLKIVKDKIDGIEEQNAVIETVK